MNPEKKDRSSGKSGDNRILPYFASLANNYDIHNAGIQQFVFGATPVSLIIPPGNFVREKYESEKRINNDTGFPYWAKLWPSAIALCRFMEKNKEIIAGKKVMELAGGLGLPSLLAAQYARRVISSDYMEEAVLFQNSSAELNGLTNMKCLCIDWNDLPVLNGIDIVLLSDVNYDPSRLNKLLRVIEYLLQEGMTIIMATPHRLQGRSFITSLLLYSRMNGLEEVRMNDEKHLISVILLQK